MPKGENLRKISDKQRREIVKIYTTRNEDGTWTGVTTIARMYNVANGTIQRILKINGVKMRSAKEAHAHGKQCRPVVNLPEGAPPLCKCGCGNPVEWNQRKNKWYSFITSHPIRKHHNKDWLYHQYAVLHKTSYEIAELSGVTKGTILSALRKHDIPVRTQAESLRLSGGVAGENNPAWNGGVTPERQRFYKTDKWRKIVKQVFKRDHYHCVRCEAPKKGKGSLHVHHIKPWADYPEHRFELGNLITLCRDCHTWVHSLDNVDSEYLY